jgi:hypothetical protein
MVLETLFVARLGQQAFRSPDKSFSSGFSHSVGYKKALRDIAGL